MWTGHHVNFANIEIEALADNRIAVLFVMFSIDLVLFLNDLNDESKKNRGPVYSKMLRILFKVIKV